MKKLFYPTMIAMAMLLQSCGGCSSGSSYGGSSSGLGSSYDNDETYWNSVSREQALEDAGMEGAANIERKARQEYMRGGGYTSKDGGRQIHYQGSREQEEHLRMMDEMGW